MPVFAQDSDSDMKKAQEGQGSIVREKASLETLSKPSKDKSDEKKAQESQGDVVREAVSSETVPEILYSKSKEEEPVKVTKMLVYVPPLRGTPGGRVGGGTRSVDGEGNILYALAPDHVGLTIREQPCLYWFIPKSTNHPIEFTLIESRAIEPLIERRIAVPEVLGIQCIRLSEYNMHLQKGVLYKWFVSIVPDSDNRSKDTLAGGMIECVDELGQLHQKLNETNKDGVPYVYAEAGLWYDTLAAISNLIDASPSDTSFREQRASLLTQVGLDEVAEFDRDYHNITAP
jgi:hypothetical protein